MIWDSKSWCVLGFKLAIFTLNPTLKKYFASQIWLFLFVLTSYFPKISILRWKINIMGFMGCKILGFMGFKCITYIRRLLLFYFFKYFIIIILLIFSFFYIVLFVLFFQSGCFNPCFIFQCFTKTTSYVKFGMQNGFTLTYMWFDVSILGFKHGGDNGIQIHFTFSHVCFDDMNLGCKILVDFGIQIWYAFCICRNHLILEMILLLFKLNDWWIKWHDGHGLVIRLIEYGHILIDATLLVFLIYWMYIIHPFFHWFGCFCWFMAMFCIHHFVHGLFGGLIVPMNIPKHSHLNLSTGCQPDVNRMST